MAARCGDCDRRRACRRSPSALALWVGTLQSAALPILWGVGFALRAIAALRAGAPPCRAQRACRRRGAGRRSAPPISAGTTRRTNRPGCRRRTTRRCVRTPTDETVALLKAKLAAAAAPDRRDRVELIGIAYHWPNIGLIHDFDHLFGHNPLRLQDFERATARGRHGGRRRPAAVSAAVAVLSFDAGKPVRRALHRHRRAGRADRHVAQAGRPRSRSRAPRTPTSTKIRARCRA